MIVKRSGPYPGLAGPGGGPRGYGGTVGPAPRSNGEVAERPKAHAWKACIRQRIVGSNPTLSASYARSTPRAKRVGGPGGRRESPPWWRPGGPDLEVRIERRTAMVGR